MKNRYIEINIGDERITSENFDIEGVIYFTDAEVLDTVTAYIWNADVGLQDRNPPGTKATLVLGEDESFIGVVEDIDYIETSTDRGLMISLSNGSDKVNNRKLTGSFKNTNYSDLLRWMALELGFSLGRISNTNNITFNKYTIFHTLSEFLREIRINTGAFSYIKDGFVYSTQVENNTVSISEEDVYFNRTTENEKSLIKFRTIIGRVDENIKVKIGDNIYRVAEGKHMFSNDKDWFTEIEGDEIDQ